MEFLKVFSLIQNNISKKSVEIIISLLENMPCMKADAFLRVKRRDGMFNLKKRKMDQFRQGEFINYVLSEITSESGTIIFSYLY